MLVSEGSGFPETGDSQRKEVEGAGLTDMGPVSHRPQSPGFKRRESLGFTSQCIPSKVCCHWWWSSTCFTCSSLRSGCPLETPS